MTKYCPLVEQLDIYFPAPDVYELFQLDKNSVFLDSGMDPLKLGIYSFIGVDPFMVMKSKKNNVTVIEQDRIIKTKADPFDKLNELLEMYKVEPLQKYIPFAGGAAGYLSYDLCHFIENLPNRAVDDLRLPESYFCFYDLIIAFDNLERKTYIVSTGFPEFEENKRVERARMRAGQIKNRISRLKEYNAQSNLIKLWGRAELKSNFTRHGYIKAVEKVRQYIKQGDVFQVNLSQRFETDLAIPPYELYRRLRTINPAPFAAYLNFDGITVASASPERYLKLTGDLIETRPIKGTRPRGKNPAEDSKLAGELLKSAKDQAENIMIVDLERNDIGRVCCYGSVKVTELAILETFPTVFHLTSTVTGTLRQDKNRNDLLKATFPGGSITGAPKVRAMEIIDELEPTRRSVYTGAIGYLSFDGGIDLNIAIRTFIIKNKRVYFQAGGGIIYDSDAREEYQETLVKAKALVEALQLSSAKGSEIK